MRSRGPRWHSHRPIHQSEVRQGHLSAVPAIPLAATSWRPAAASGKRGARFVNGFEFIRTFETWKDQDGKPLVGAKGALESRLVERPFVRIRRDDRHHVRYDMGRANVLDLATLAHTPGSTLDRRGLAARNLRGTWAADGNATVV